MTTTYLINRMSTPLLDMKSFYIMLYQKVLDYKSLKAFRCACYPHLRPYFYHKFNSFPRMRVYRMYSSHHKGYKCIAPSGRIHISKDQLFNEIRFPYQTITTISATSNKPTPISHTLLIFPSPQIYLPQIHQSNINSLYHHQTSEYFHSMKHWRPPNTTLTLPRPDM